MSGLVRDFNKIKKYSTGKFGISEKPGKTLCVMCEYNADCRTPNGIIFSKMRLSNKDLLFIGCNKSPITEFYDKFVEKDENYIGVA